MNAETNQIFLINPPENQQTSVLQKLEVPAATPVHLENVCDFSQVCRVCATITECMIPLYAGEGLQNNLADKINKHLPIQVCEDDQLPLSLCYQCSCTLLAWHELTLCCQQADSALRTRLAQLTQQQEVCVPEPQAAPVQEPEPPTHSADPRDEKCVPPPAYPESPRACAYCPLMLSPSHSYQDHLVDEHSDLLFHCDECDTYVARTDFILHMAVHVITCITTDKGEPHKHDHGENVAEEPCKHDHGVDITEEEPSKHDHGENIAEEEPSKHDHGENIAEEEPSKHDHGENIAKEEPSKHDNGENITKEKVSKHHHGDNIAIEDPSKKQEAKQTKEPKETKEEKKQSEFSDHSDADDFEPLPDSVFQAIEDSQDSQPDTSKSNNTSPSESPVKKKKKSKVPRTCPICAKVYTASSSYFYHMKYFHKNTKDHECDRCGKKFGTKASLTNHLALHTAEFQFECKDCHKKFRSKASLYIHEQTHNGVKSYACSQCQTKFRWRTHLKRHLKRHSADKCHVCSTCGKGFSIRSDLLRHSQTHTAGNHTCDKCGAKFAQLRYLKVHVDRKHSINGSSTSTIVPDTLL